jgi:hypothetical protein
MADFGELPFIAAAVQVIPVLGIVVVADSFIRRDAGTRVHRIYASHAAAVGLVWGIAGEVAGLQALLTGPTRQTIPVIDAGLMALAATVLGPRLAELHVPQHPDAARRLTQRMLPFVIGAVGLVFATWRTPLGHRVILYAFLAVTLLLRITTIRAQPLSDETAGLSDQEVEQLAHRVHRVLHDVRPTGASLDDQDCPSRPTVLKQVTPKRMARWWVAASVTGVAIAVMTGRRREVRQRRSDQLRP